MSLREVSADEHSSTHLITAASPSPPPAAAWRASLERRGPPSIYISEGGRRAGAGEGRQRAGVAWGSGKRNGRSLGLVVNLHRGQANTTHRVGGGNSSIIFAPGRPLARQWKSIGRSW